MAEELKTICPWCRETAVPESFLSLGANNDLGLSYNLARCPHCRAVFVFPGLDPAKIKEYFSSPSRYQTALDPDGRAVDPFSRAEGRRAEYEGYGREIRQRWPEQLSRRVLDLGAGLGLMLSLLPDNFELLAVEPNPEAAVWLRKKQINCLNEWAEDLDFKAESFGLIILNQTLDHLSEPGLLVERLYKWLQPGGFILLSGLINPDCLMARLYGPRFRLWHPMHRLYLNPKTAMSLFASLGFTAVKWWQPYFGTPYGGLGKMLLHLPQVVATALAGHGRRPSPAWPGNTFSLLLQKNLLLIPLKSAEEQLESSRLQFFGQQMGRRASRQG